MSQLPIDCLNEIFKYLENDKATLHSCLLVNRLWCKISVEILWRSVWNFNTLIACLPNESKEILYKHELIIPTPNSKTPLFNYVSFIKSLEIDSIIEDIQGIIFLSNKINKYFNYSTRFTSLPEAKHCLKYLSKFSCHSDINPEFFYKLSRICHHIQSLNIRFRKTISGRLTDLISVQKNLKYLMMKLTCDCGDLNDIIPSLPNTLVKLAIYGSGRGHLASLLFIAKFTNLQELELISSYGQSFEEFNGLQDITFSQLQILKLQYRRINEEILIKFLENNGKNLRELYIDDIDCDHNLLNLSIPTLCPNLSKLYTDFNYNELETLKVILNACQYLESIKLWCNGIFLNEKDVLMTIVEDSPKNFYELKLCFEYEEEYRKFSELFEPFLISWANRISQKSLSLIIVNTVYFEEKVENMKIIESYIKSGVIKEFNILSSEDDDRIY